MLYRPNKTPLRKIIIDANKYLYLIYKCTEYTPKAETQMIGLHSIIIRAIKLDNEKKSMEFMKYGRHLTPLHAK